jgi:hypothetical protein
MYKGGPDLILLPDRRTSTGKQRGIEIDSAAQTLGLSDRQNFPPEFLDSDDKISSLLDFAGSQIFIYRSALDCSSKSEHLIASMKPSTFDLKLGGGRKIWIPQKDFLRTALPNSCVVYSYVFPTSYEDFRNLWSKGPEE